MSQTLDHLDPRASRPCPQICAKLRILLWVLAVLGSAGCIAGVMTDARQFYFSYLTAYLFCLTLVLGMLFFVMLHHVTDSGWSVVVRRPAEQVLAALPLLAVLFAPILVGTLRGELFGWVTAQGDDPLLAGKRPYLNVPFFLVRLAIYFGVWLGLARIMRRNSIRQDADGQHHYTFAMRRGSAPGLLLYAFTFTFASFDWIMSLDYAWFSTIFGVYTWSGSVVGSLALLALMAVALSRGPLGGLISGDRLHDVGKLLFAFCVFWAYIAFSQYFLIWYGNIPEETIWFLHRWKGVDQPAAWWPISIALPVGLFLLPFLVLMPAHAKRSPRALVIMSLLLLAMHYLDVYWMVMPVLHPRGPAWSAAWIDISALVLIASASALSVVRAMGRAALYPLRDPRLQESLMAEHAEEVLAADVE